MNKNNIDLNISYNPRQSVTNYEILLKSSKRKANNALMFLHGSLDAEYGQGPLQKLDVFYKKKKKIYLLIFLLFNIAPAGHALYKL